MSQKTFGVKLENIPIQTFTHNYMIWFHLTFQIEEIVYVNAKISPWLVIEKVFYASPLSWQYAKAEKDWDWILTLSFRITSERIGEFWENRLEGLSVNILQNVKPIPRYIAQDQFADVLPNNVLAWIMRLEFNSGNFFESVVSDLIQIQVGGGSNLAGILDQVIII